MPQLQILLPLLQRRLLTPHPVEQLIQINRLLIIIGNPGTQCLDHILLVGTPSEHDRLEHPTLARQTLQRLNQLNAIHVRHVQITQHQTDFRVLTETLDRLQTGFARHTAITIAFKKLAQLLHDQRLIVDHEDFYRRRKLVHVLLHVPGQS
ncbi:hypothetical protein D3C81_1428810 [compost metagenome]